MGPEKGDQLRRGSLSIPGRFVGPMKRLTLQGADANSAFQVLRPESRGFGALRSHVIGSSVCNSSTKDRIHARYLWILSIHSTYHNMGLSKDPVDGQSPAPPAKLWRSSAKWISQLSTVLKLRHHHHRHHHDAGKLPYTQKPSPTQLCPCHRRTTY